MDETFRTVGPYEVSNLCMQSFPCMHYVKMKNGETRMLSGDDLYCMFRSEGLSDPHFDKYATFVRLRDFPTFTELVERLGSWFQRNDQMRKCEQERKEREAIVDQYKSSTRTERLKQKHAEKQCTLLF